MQAASRRGEASEVVEERTRRGGKWEVLEEARRIGGEADWRRRRGAQATAKRDVGVGLIKQTEKGSGTQKRGGRE